MFSEGGAVVIVQHGGPVGERWEGDVGDEAGEEEEGKLAARRAGEADKASEELLGEGKEGKGRRRMGVGAAVDGGLWRRARGG